MSKDLLVNFASSKIDNFNHLSSENLLGVFLLVIFFVVTSKVGDSQFLNLDLPKTESFQYNTVQTSNEIMIYEDGSIYINENYFNINDLNDIEDAIFRLENAGESLILSAHSNSLHVWVITIMDILNKYGFNEVQIRTIER